MNSFGLRENVISEIRQLAERNGLEEEVNTLLTFDVVDTALPMQDELRDSIEKEGVLIYEKV